MYGLSGASGKAKSCTGWIHCWAEHILGRHCSLWCHITSGELKQPLFVRGRLPERSLQTLQRDHSNFMANGGDISKAKLFNNVIGSAMLDIPLDKVKNR